MTIINPKSIAGVTSITTPSGSDNLFTVHTNNTTERIRINNDGDVIVGSGITVSPDGDIFATGVTTATTFSGSGASLTNLNASNIASGTVPTARLGSGTASSSTFLRGDSTFATVTSVGGATGVDFNDDVKIRLGTGNDLEIYHGSDQNYVSVTGTGNLNLTSVGAVVTKVNSTEDAIVCNANGSVDLYYDASKKLETTNTGVDVTGNFGMSGSFTGNFVPSTNDSFDLGSSSYQWQDLFLANSVDLVDDAKVLCGTGDDLKLYHSSNNSYLTNDTGYLFVQSDSISLAAKSAGENFLVANKDGAVGLYYDSVEKFTTESEGVRIRCSGNAGLRVDGTVADVNPRITFRRHSNDGGNAEPAAIQMTYVGGTTYESGHIDFYTNGDSGSAALSHRMRIRNDGHVGIGDDDPSYLLHLKEASDTGYVINTATVNTALMLENPQTGSTKNIAIYFAGCYSDGEGYISLVGDGGSGGDFRFALRSGGSRTDRMTITNDSTINGDFNDTSDINLKENIASISSSIDKVKQLRPVTFDWKESYRPNNVSGFIAQEVKTIYPDLVRGKEWTAEDPGKHYTINTMGVVAHLTKALQESITKIEVLETRLNNAGIAT